MIQTKLDVNRIRADSISNFKWPYFFVCLSMGLAVVYFFAQNFTLYPMVTIVSVEYDFRKSSIFYPLFWLYSFACNVSLWPIKNFVRPFAKMTSNTSNFRIKFMWLRRRKVVTDPKVWPPTIKKAQNRNSWWDITNFMMAIFLGHF